MEKTPVVIDSGSGFCRAGFANDDQPQSVIRTVVTFPRYNRNKLDNVGPDSKRTGDQYTMLKLKPVNCGIITDWCAMELFWDHVFKCELKVFSDDQVAYMTDSPSSPLTNREKMAEILFEYFDVPGLHIYNTAFLSLCSMGATTGLVIETGCDVSHTTTIIEGENLRDTTYRLDIAGSQLSKYLSQLLLDSKHISHSMCMEQVPQIKEKYCYISLDYGQEMSVPDKHFEVELPDHKKILLGKEAFQCMEPIFKPNILGYDFPGLHKMALLSLEKVPEKYNKEVLNNIILSGGTSMCRNFSERIQEEMMCLCPWGSQLKFIINPKRNMAAWTGAAVVACLNISKLKTMTKDDYTEHGASYVYNKFNLQ
ncbi:uncharacterized protein RCH25_053005 [Pelodytes ibericus]